jgi:hypothetical protein
VALAAALPAHQQQVTYVRERISNPFSNICSSAADESYIILNAMLDQEGPAQTSWCSEWAARESIIDCMMQAVALQVVPTDVPPLSLACTHHRVSGRLLR